MSAVAVLAADGFETIECLTAVDVLRRGGVRTTLVSVMDTRDVVTAQQISITCDATLDEVNLDEYDYLMLPGGMPGTLNLRRDERVCDAVRDFAEHKHVAAICAAPSILGELGLLVGRRATCFPGFEDRSRRGPLRARRAWSWTATSSRRAPWGRPCRSRWPFCRTSPAKRPSKR